MGKNLGVLSTWRGVDILLVGAPQQLERDADEGAPVVQELEEVDPLLVDHRVGAVDTRTHLVLDRLEAVAEGDEPSNDP